MLKGCGVMANSKDQPELVLHTPQHKAVLKPCKEVPLYPLYQVGRVSHRKGGCFECTVENLRKEMNTITNTKLLPIGGKTTDFNLFGLLVDMDMDSCMVQTCICLPFLFKGG